jgi:hypothetical protein
MKDVSGDGVQTPTYETDSSGYPCHIMPKAVYETRRGKQVEASVTHVIELRYYCNFKPNDIIENEDTDVRYSIKGIIDDDGYGRQMVIHANEVVV